MPQGEVDRYLEENWKDYFEKPVENGKKKVEAFQLTTPNSRNIDKKPLDLQPDGIIDNGKVSPELVVNKTSGYDKPNDEPSGRLTPPRQPETDSFQSPSSRSVRFNGDESIASTNGNLDGIYPIHSASSNRSEVNESTGMDKLDANNFKKSRRSNYTSDSNIPALQSSGRHRLPPRIVSNKLNKPTKSVQQNDDKLSPKTPFRKRFAQFNTSEALSKGFTFKNPWKKNVRKAKRDQETVSPSDYQKSAQLIWELAGGPAAILIASQLQRDDRGMKRVPVLLEQLQVNITYSGENEDHRFLWHDHKKKMLNLKFNYGSGPARLTWSVQKTHRDFSYLNGRLTAASFQVNPFGVSRLHLPKLPKPYMRVRSRSNSQNHSFTHHGRRSNAPSINSRSSFSSADSSDESDGNIDDAEIRNEPPAAETNVGNANGHSRGRSVAHITRVGNRRNKIENPNYLEQMENYLKAILRLYMFRSDVNRLLQFLELSNMSIRLAPEHSYNGKQGLLYTQTSSAAQGWQVSHWKPTDVPKMILRHTHKWYMVRHSYIAVVENITGTNILEVFMVDPSFSVSRINTLTADAVHHDSIKGDNTSIESERDAANEEAEGDGDETQKRTITSLRYSLQLENNERKLKIASSSEKEIVKWYNSILEMKRQTVWAQKHRFDSFAPIRQNIHCQWLVDARDYFWTLSEAIDQAKDVIYIHDWWMSPELYLRRPPQGNQQWRLDRLLKKKAEQGVKIFIILYRNVGTTIPIDSLYSKYSLLDLHPNIYAMRSPNPLVLGTLFWAHHEKICLIDHTVGFVGGLDLCYGRYDTPDHILADDASKTFFMGNETDEELLQKTRIWPGKDYSNARVKDFYELDRPYEDMYDRHKVPRMPWHDVHLMMVGQPIRDLSRHFVQRWNYLIRQKRPSRPTPLLLPPPDLSDEDSRRMDLQGTCEVQILRSSGSWSLGLNTTEHSIQNAYLKAIETSEHFIYIENQFFITSTVVEGTVIENKIGDALVERIIRAHQNCEQWRAVIVIPLMPGFEADVDLPAASSVRLIMMCQYLSISRGPNSIFGRLEAEDINPDDYISFFSLRKWGRVGPNKKLVTEQLYIHAKTLIADDRLAIIGSANINERSQLGTRDSEVAAIIRDIHQVESRMGGEPYMVGVFPHTLRMRLMREHLGIDVDKVDAIDQEISSSERDNQDRETTTSTQPNGAATSSNTGTSKKTKDYIPTEEMELHSFNHFAGIDNKGFKGRKNVSTDSRVQGNKAHREDILGFGTDGLANLPNVNKRLKKLRAQQENQNESQKGVPTVAEAVASVLEQKPDIDDIIEFKKEVYALVTADHGTEPNGNKTDNEGSTEVKADSGFSEHPDVQLDPYVFYDPLDDSFYIDKWCNIATKNTEIFRQIFRCQPDDEVTTWKAYKDFVAFSEKFSTAQDVAGLQPTSTAEENDVLSPLGPDIAHDIRQKAAEENDSTPGETTSEHPGSTGTTDNIPKRRRRATTLTKPGRTSTHMSNIMYTQKDAELILKGIQGNLVWFPTNWLSTEFDLGNWWFNFDRLPPLDIYD